MRPGRYILACAVIIAAIEMLYFYPLMPERMAVHFNESGIADGWGDRQHFFTTFGILYGLMIFLFAGFGLAIRFIPEAWINLPNKSYWLAPERKKKTYDTITDQMLFLGGITMLLMDGVMYLSFSANLLPNPAMPAEIIWLMLALFIVITLVSIIYIVRSFRKTVDTP
jgi:uncharacterized membrane protein